MSKRLLINIVPFVITALMASCSHEESPILLTRTAEGWDFAMTRCVYNPGDKLTIEISPQTPTSHTIILKNISQRNEPILTQSTDKLSWEIDKIDSTATYSIGIFVKSPQGNPQYVTCIRVAADSALTTYRIDKTAFDNLTVYRLNGGMSAEYAIEKSLSNLTGNISQTWDIGPGGGPSPVWGAPDFLEKSLRYTIDLYNRELGEEKEIETVIISTGAPSIPYLSAALKAPVLPLHFLVSVNACKEIQSIMDYSRQKGYKTYATLGYDASMSGVGVAWIKLLDIPEEYIQFIANHRVKNVIIAGVGENVHGESYARRLKNKSEKEEYAPGSIYLQYTNHGSEKDMQAITSNIVDYEEQNLDTVCMIADWESGILERQIEAFGERLARLHIDCYALTAAENMIDLYDLATDVALEHIKKNHLSPMRVTFNEYLISEPMYELSNGHIPLLYWQFVPASLTVDRLDKYVATAITRVFPESRVKELNVHLNARIGKYDLAEILKEHHYSHITMRADNIEEVWDLSDGLNAPCEIVANDIVNRIGIESYKTTVEQSQPLTIDEIARVSSRLPGISFHKTP